MIEMTWYNTALRISRRKPGPTFQRPSSGKVGPGFRRGAGD
jgi:hypothetical protein